MKEKKTEKEFNLYAKDILKLISTECGFDYEKVTEPVRQAMFDIFNHAVIVGATDSEMAKIALEQDSPTSKNENVNPVKASEDDLSEKEKQYNYFEKVFSVACDEALASIKDDIDSDPADVFLTIRSEPELARQFFTKESVEKANIAAKMFDLLIYFDNRANR